VEIDVVSSSDSAADIVFPKLHQSDEQSWKKSFGSVKVPVENLKKSSVDGKIARIKLLKTLDWHSRGGLTADASLFTPDGARKTIGELCAYVSRAAKKLYRAACRR
jgi:hypothetical protein